MGAGVEANDLPLGVEEELSRGRVDEVAVGDEFEATANKTLFLLLNHNI